MTSPLRRKRRITAWPTTVTRAAISFAVVAAGGVAAGQTPPGVAASVERTIYLQKPAETVIPAQALAPPAPPPVFSPLALPVMQTPIGADAIAIQLPPVPATPQDPKLNLTSPKREDVFRFDSDATLAERIRKELSDQYKIAVEMPVSPTIASKVPVTRSLPSMQVQIEPAYVVHRRLFFEQKNPERAGWDLGAAQPLASALHFYKDCLIYPYRLSSNLLEAYDTSAGKSLPGSPTPLLLYPQDITLFGFVVGSGTIFGVQAILP